MSDNKLEEFIKTLPSPPGRPLTIQDAVPILLRNPAAQPRMLEWNGQQALVVALPTVATPRRPLPFTLTPWQIENLHAVKQYITDVFPRWPDHTILCRKAGMNDFKLKAGFKHLFKMTAYDYHLRLKFQEAKKLLLENKESIRAIAYQVGYDHHASFTQEFKKQFGYTPSWFKMHGQP